MDKFPGFEDMNLQVGAKLQLLLQRDGKQVKYFTSLIGYVMGEYLLAQIPVDNGSPITLNVGERIVVKGFSGVRVFSFDCSVTRRFSSPFSYVHLSFPLTIQSTAFRAAIRVKVDIPAKVYMSDIVDNPRAIPATLTNLSVDGALFEARVKIGDVHNLVRLTFEFPDSSGDDKIRVDTKSIIRNVKPKRTVTGGEAAIFVYGVQFDHIDQIQQEGLQNFIYKTHEHNASEDRKEEYSTTDHHVERR